MSDTYMITVPIELDTKNAREKLKAQFTSFKQDVEGELYKIRITADTKDLDKIRESLKGLKAEEIAKINIQVDRSGFDKQLLNLKNATGKSADDIGKTFKKTIQDNFESLSLDDLIQKQFDGKRYSGGRASEVVKNLYGTVTTPLPKDADFISVVRMAEAYEQLGNALSELKQKSPREYEKLDFKESDIKNATKAFYNNIGNMMLDESVRNNFIEQINTSFQTLNENISTLMSSIIDDSKKLGDGLGGGVGQISEEVQRQVDAISTQIDDTTKKIEEMEAKLQELQTRKTKMPNFFKTITDADGNRVKLGIDDLIKQQQDEINNAKRSIEELEEKKKQLLSGSGTGGGAGNGTGSGSGTGNGNGNGTTTVGVEPDSTQFISKLQEQINGQHVDVDVKPKTENFVDDIKSSISNSNIEIGVQPKIDVSQPISQPDLIGKLSSQMNEYMEKAGTSRGNGYWDQLRDSFSQLDTETKKLLNDLGLLNSEANGINTINVGANNFGGIIGNKNTLIARSNISQEYLSAADELKNKLDAAAESGVNVARILNNVYDPKNKVMFQLMETLPGTDMSTLGQNVELVNLDALQASDEQVKKLISDLKVLYDLGLGIDVESGNLLFDKLQGFSLIDLDLKPIHNSFEELVADVMRYLDDIRVHFEDAGNQSGVGFVNGFESKFKSLLKAGNESPQKTDAQLYDETKGFFKKAGNIKQLHEQYQSLSAINRNIQVWEKNPSGSIINHPDLTLQATLEQLQAYKAEILELNPQLQAVADSVERIGSTRFEQKFGSSFPSFGKLVESYDRMNLLQQKINDFGPNVIDSEKSRNVADLERQKQAFVEMYEAYYNMSDGVMNQDISGKRNIPEITNAYLSLKQAIHDTNQEMQNVGSQNSILSGSESLKELVELYHQLGTTNGNQEDLNRIADAILSIVQAENKLDPLQMQKFVMVLKGLTFVEGDSPITKIPYTVEEAIESLNKLKDAKKNVGDEIQAQTDNSQETEESAQAHEHAAQAAAEHAEQVANVAQSEASIPPSTEAEQSAQADQMAADAANARTQANENLADSEQKINQAESSNTGADIAIGSISSATGQALSTITSTQSTEIGSLNSLITKLGEVTTAIDAKTRAFQQEASVVDGVVSSEINMLDALLGEINLILGDLEKLSQGITTLPEIDLKMKETGQDSTINGQYTSVVEQLKKAFEGFDYSSISGLGDVINSIKVTKSNVDNLSKLSDAIVKLSDAFQGLGKASSGSPEFMAIQELLQNAEALKDLAKILQASQDQINKAKQAVGGKSTGGVSTEVEELRKYNQAVKEYYEAQTRLQTGKTDKKAQDELQSANALKIIEQYEAKINEMQQKGIELSKQQTNAIKARQDAEEKLAATVKDYNDTQQKKAVDEQKKQIENTVSGIGKQIEKMWTVTTGKTPAYTDEITKLEGQYHELQTVISGIDWNGDAEAQLQDVQQSIRSLQANINDVRSGREFRIANDNKIASINRSMSEWMQRNSGAGDYLDQVRALQTELQKVGSMTDLDKVIQGFEGIKAAAADAGKTGKSFMDMLSGSFKNLAKYLLTFASFYRVIGYIKSAVNVVKELDTAMVEIRKVTTESVESLERFSRSSFNMADKYGTTAKQIQESTASWLRLGENFQQATESAQMSAYLLNTTEISSIDEATEDLVSISQAYKEISKSDIIDKLNNIGDHFSSSSSDLAQGLKNASAVLKTQGNDIDKALALLTAGNNITQDISKTSAGIRTIALRISGTEEAKNEIADMGEDVDDFVVRTKSKTDQIIRDYTAVASNAYKGVSVLDQNGNLRDTYSILLDIAEIYKEIQAEDQKAGTNRAQALVEQLAGKNRSNIAASILQNPELLRQSYEAAQNSQGVGQKELNVYLDSVEAKLKKLQNRLQELAAVTIDSEWLKALVDFGTQAIQVFTKLSETFGGLNVIIGSVMGIMMQKSGKGIFNYDKITKSWSFGLKNIFSGIKDNINKEVFSGVEGAFKDVSKSSSITDAITTVVNTGQDVIPAGFKDFYNSLEDKTISLGKAMAMYKEQVNGATSAMGVFKNIGMNALSTVGNILLSTIASMAVSAAINLVIKGFDEILHHSEKVIEAGKKAGTKIDEIQDGIREKLDFDDNSKERYIELRSGVNIDTGKNISLTNEEYEEYISLSNQIADMYPSLVSSFDESGNAVLRLSKNADQATESLSNLIEQDRIIAGNEIKDQLEDRVKGAIEEVDTYRDQISDLEEEVSGYVTVGNVLSGKSDAMDLFSGVTFDINSDAAKAFEDAVLSNNSKFYDDFAQRVEDDGLGNVTVTYYLSTEGIENIQDESYLQELNDVLKEYGFTESEDYYRKQNEKNAKIGSVEGQINEVWRGVAEDIISSFQADPIYNNLSEELKSSISQMMYGLDYEEIFKDMPDEDLSNIGEIFADKYLTPIVSAISDNGVIDEEKAKIFDQLLSLDTSDMTNSELRGDYNKLVEQLSEDEEIQKDILVTLNIGYRDENGEFHYNATKRRNELFEAIGGTVTYDEKGYATTHSNFSGNFIGFDKFSTLDQSDFDAMEYMRDSMGVPLEDIKSWDDLIAKIQEAKKEMESTPEVENTDTLASLFSDEKYSSAAEGYEKKLSSLTGALETIRSEGRLTGDALTGIIEEFSNLAELDEITEADLNATAFEQLNGWISLIKENMKGMSTEGIKQAINYIKALREEYGDLNITSEQARSAFQSYLPVQDTDTASHEQRKAMMSSYDSQIKELQQSLGDEKLDMEVVYTMIAMDEFSGTADEIYEKYNKNKVEWDLEIEIPEEIERLESLREYNNSRISRNEALGVSKSAADYDADNNILRGIIQSYTQQLNGRIAEGADEAVLNGIRSQIYSTEAEIAQNNKAKRELPIQQWQDALDNVKNEAEDIQRQIDDSSVATTKSMYDQLLANSDTQMEFLQKQRDYYLDLRNNAEASNNAADYKEYSNAIKEIDNEMYSVTKSQFEWNDAIAQLPIDESAQKVSELQTQAEVLQDAISYRESRGLKKSVKDYDKLLDNSKEQVKEIRKQNKLLKEQQRGLEKNSSKWNDIQSQIDSNNASLRQMVETQREWQLEAGTLATQNILDIIDKIKSAMSEGHLGAETLTSLLGESPVFAQALQHTTTGQYVDTAKMQEIINQQGDYAMQLAETQQAAEALTFTQNEQQLDALSQRTGIAKDDIEALNKAIEEHPNNPDYQKMFDLTEENANIKETILNLQALQEELKYQQSALGKYQLAQSTANASDNMQTIRGGLEGAKELYDQGWIGKDDFTTFADLIATDAEIAAGTAVENFEKNYNRVQRYLTEDASGVHNWFDDMIAKSKEYGETWAVLNEETGDYKIDVKDMQEFAKAMGTSTEFAEDMLMAMKDANYVVDLSVIGDQYANDFKTIDYMAANAGQQVKNLITEMGQLADSGVDVSGGAEAAAEAIQKLADNGVDVTDLVTQFNELGKLNGWKLEFGEDGELVFSSEFMSAVQKEAARATQQQEIPLYTKFNIEEAEVTNANNALQRAFQGNKADMQQAIKDSGILDYDFADLMNIKHADGELQAGEQELEAFAHSLGLADEQCSALLVAMAQLGLIDVEPEVNTDQVEEATEKVDELSEASDKKLKIGIAVENTISDIVSQVKEKIHQENVENVKIKIEEEISKGSITPQEILNMNDEQITAHFNIEGNGKEEIQAIRDAAAEINAQDGADFTIKINEEQLNSLIDAVNQQQEAPVEVDMDTTAWDAFKEEVEGGLTAKVTTDTPTAPTNPFPNVQTGRSSITVDGQMAVKQVNAFNDMISNIGSGKSSIELDTSEALSKITALQTLIDGIDNKEVTVTLADGGIDEQIATINGYITELTSVPASVSINLDGQMFMQQLSDLNTMIEEVPDANPTVNANTAAAVARINNVSSILGKLNGKAANVYVNVIDRVSSVLRNIQSQLNTLNGKTSTITIVTERKTKYTTEGRGQQALGTAHSTGTAYSMWTDYRHSKNAYAAGSAQDWRLGEDQEALVNELAPQHPESIVRDGRWMIIPGGPHVEQLKKNDIIFNAEQTEDLIRTGRTARAGKIALANGTAHNGIRAFVDPTKTNAKGSGNISTTSKGKTTINTGTTTINTGSTKSPKNGNKDQKSAWDLFKEYLGKLFDWIEVRIERTQARIDNLLQKSENAIGYANGKDGKNDYINQAMNVIGDKVSYSLQPTKDYQGGQIVTGIDYDRKKYTAKSGTQMANNLAGADRYFKQAQAVYDKAKATNDISKNSLDDMVKKIQAGQINISEYNEKQREFIDAYKEW